MNKNFFDVSFFQSNSANLETIIFLVLGCTLFCVAVFFIYKKYMRFKKEQELQEEMELRDFESVESSTVNDLVKRYKMNEPINIMYSLKLFDELAQKEMSRVLSSPLSSQSKTQYVDLLYRIRQKMYSPSEMSTGHQE